MSEPQAVAERAEEVVAGLWRWFLADERIGGHESDAHAIASEGGVVLVDPLPLAPAALAALGPVEAICLTARCHQRSSWRLRRALGVPVCAPADGQGYEEEPDRRYAESDVLPGGLRTIRTPGPERPHYALLREGQRPCVLFCPDLVMRAGGGLAFVPPEYHESPAETRQSVERLAALDFDILCLDHGAPFTERPHDALLALLAA